MYTSHCLIEVYQDMFKRRNALPDIFQDLTREDFLSLPAMGDQDSRDGFARPLVKTYKTRRQSKDENCIHEFTDGEYLNAIFDRSFLTKKRRNAVADLRCSLTVPQRQALKGIIDKHYNILTIQTQLFETVTPKKPSVIFYG